MKAMKEMQDLNERLEAEKRTLSRNLDRLKVNISSGPLDYDSDGAEGSQSDIGGGISPAARRRQMMKNKNKNGLKGDVPSDNDGHRGLWARIRNKKDNKSNPVEIHQRQGKNRRSSHLPAEQGEGRSSRKSRGGEGEDYSGSEGSDGGEIYNEDDLGEQMLTSESYSDSDTRESEQHTSRTLKNSRSGGGGNSAAESEALAAARAQLASQAEAAIAQAKEMADLAGANDDLRRKVASLEKENKELKVLLCGVGVCLWCLNMLIFKNKNKKRT
jgi:hypothetical protein